MNSVERYYQKKKRRKKKAKVLFFTLLFILLMMTLSILSMTVFFNADKITVEGNTHYSAEEILAVGKLKLGQNLIRFDKFKVIERMEGLPYIKEVTIRRKLPNTLKVDIIENSAVVWVECGGKAALLNEEYRILEFAELLPLEEMDGQQAPPEEESSEEEQTNAPQEEQESSDEEGEPSEEESSLLEEEEPEAPTIADTMRPALEGNVPFLKGVNCAEGKAGEYLKFPEEQDYTGFLKLLYEEISRNEGLDWAKVDRVDFNARFDIRLQYSKTITIDLGTLDRVDTKLDLAAYLLEDNGTGRKATIDVSDTERVYFRPEHE